MVRDTLAVLALGTLLLAALEGGARLAGLGATDPPLPPKRDGVFRIVALGGSTVQGVPDGRFGFVAQLGETLPSLARGRDVEVLNLARSGLSSRRVRALALAALDASPDLVVVLTGHNEFLAPVATRGLRGALQRVRDRSHLARALTRAADSEPADPLPERLTPVDPDGRLRADAESAHRENLEAIVAATTAAHVPLYLCTAPVNLADWPPAHRRIGWTPPRPDLDDAVHAIRAALAGHRADAAIKLAQAWLGKHGDDAIIHYLLGRAQRETRAWDAARASFERALDLDPVPRRAFRSMNESVRAYAGREGVRVVDVARVFETHAERGLVGFGLVCDNCHPTPLGHSLIAREIARALAEDGLLLGDDVSLGPAEEWAARAWGRLGDEEQQARARLRWLLSNAIYTMKSPFLNFEASTAYLEQARAIAPRDWRVHANLGSIALLEGREDEGRRALDRAARLKGTPLDPDDRANTPYVKEALARVGAGGS